MSLLNRISFAGGFVVLASLVFYQLILSGFPVETRNIEFLGGIAYAVLALVLTGVCVSVVGATRYLRFRSLEIGTTNFHSSIAVISLALKDRRSFRTFVLASVLYGLFFGFVSSLLVYRPLEGFSEAYGVSVPSILPVICCGQLGQMPQFVIYLTQQFAILIIPVNLILLVSVSWLVGLNVAITTYSYKNRPSNIRSHWLGGLGAIVGLFTACPTCAGFFVLTSLGIAGAVTVTLSLSSLQVVFSAVGLPLLLLTPFEAARKISKGSVTSCPVPADNQLGGGKK